MTNRPKAPRGQAGKARRSAVERWNRAVREASRVPDAAADAAADARGGLQASDEEIERQLREAGVDLDGEDAKADATFRAAEARFGKGRQASEDDVEGPTSSQVAWVAPSGPRSAPGVRRDRRVVWLAYAAAAALATGGAAYVAAHYRHEEPKKEEPPVVPSPEAAAPAVTSAPAVIPKPPPAPTPTPSQSARVYDKGPR